MIRAGIFLAFAVFFFSQTAIAQTRDESIEFFRPTTAIPTLKITLDQETLKELNRDPRKYVKSTVRVDDKTYVNVGLHLKGAAGSWRNWDDKPGLTLNFDKFTDQQRFRGLDKIHLNNGVQDGSFLQELLANELAMALGVPACRCTHAIAELNGRKVGPYVLKEGFDKLWLKRHFKTSDGNLYDGGFLTDINGELKLDHGTDIKRADLKALVKACNEGDANKRFAETSKLLDVDLFCANAALQIVTADWDGYIRKPNNYRIWIPKIGKAVIIPHGMDQMWQNPGEGLWHGWGGMVARAILDHPEGKKKTIEKLKILTDNHFTTDKLNKRIDELALRLRDAMIPINKGWAENYKNEVNWLKERIKQRVELLKREFPKL